MKALFLLALLALPLVAAADGDGVSTTPYAALYGLLAQVHDINARDRLIAVERIESKLPDVRPETIHIVIHAKAGAIAVPISADGSVQFPITDALRDENPPVETNQPKGSLALTVSVGLRGVKDGRAAWSDIDAALTQAQQLYAASAPAGTTAPAIRGIEVHFTPGSPATLTIEGNSERLLMADGDGRIVITRDMMGAKEQPVLAFSRAPGFIIPYAGEAR